MTFIMAPVLHGVSLKQEFPPLSVVHVSSIGDLRRGITSYTHTPHPCTDATYPSTIDYTHAQLHMRSQGWC